MAKSFVAKQAAYEEDSRCCNSKRKCRCTPKFVAVHPKRLAVSAEQKPVMLQDVEQPLLCHRQFSGPAESKLVVSQVVEQPLHRNGRYAGPAESKPVVSLEVEQPLLGHRSQDREQALLRHRQFARPAESKLVFSREVLQQPLLRHPRFAVVAESKLALSEYAEQRLSPNAESELSEAANNQSEGQTSGGISVGGVPVLSPLAISGTEDALNLCGSITEEVLDKCRSHTKKYMLRGKQEDAKFRPIVCLVCDRFIIGVEEIFLLSTDRVKEHHDRLSVARYKEKRRIEIPDSLVQCYHVEGFDGMLLSPRSWSPEPDKHVLCKNCYLSLERRNIKRKSAPKFAIANSFAIGEIPRSVAKQDEISDLLASLIAPVRPFSFLFSYSGGSQKTIKGHIMFFQNDVEHAGRVLHHYDSTGANTNVYVVLCGRFTKSQRRIAKEKARLDVSQFLEVLRWFIQTNCHPAFKEITLPQNLPRPTYIEEEETDHNTDDSVDPEIESTYDGGRFFFPSAHEPDENVGAHGSQDKFIRAMLSGSAPTLLFHGGAFANERQTPIANMFPIQFPYGLGGPSEDRDNAVSEMECLRHYSRLSLPQMHRPDFALVLCAMYQRIKAFSTGFLMCKSVSGGSNLAERVSTCSMESIERAAARRDENRPVYGPAADLLIAVSASCKPVGHSNEAAATARQKFFAMSDLFGESSLFLTVTPDDQNSLRVKMYATSEALSGYSRLCINQQALPSFNWSDEECFIDLNLRKRLRTSYPGACSLAYQEVMQIVIRCIIQWSEVMGCGQLGAYGLPLAWGKADEEQGRKTLHGHMQVWIQHFAKLRQLVFSSEQTISTRARTELIRYVDKVMTSSYGGKFEVVHSCGGSGEETLQRANYILKPRSMQEYRDARHRDFCEAIRGKLLECKNCSETFSSKDLLQMSVNRWGEYCYRDVVESQPNVFMRERLDVFCQRHPYDFLEGSLYDVPESDASVDNYWNDHYFRNQLLHYSYNQHDCGHRPSCFKKGCECRAVLPKYPIRTSTILFDEAQVKWSDADGTVRDVSAFEILTRRRPGDEFVNTFSSIISESFGCNTNIQVGDYAHMFYSTLYTSKPTQSEDTASFMTVANTINRRLTKVLVDRDETREPDFVEGLSMVLSGIRANLSGNIVSASMAHLLVSQGERFTFSHEFAYLKLSQLEDHLDGKPISYKLRKRKQEEESGEMDESLCWADAFVHDIIYRPTELDLMCAYQQLMQFERKLSYTKVDKSKEGRLYFMSEHPGNQYCYLELFPNGTFRVPIIAAANEFPDFADLEVDKDTPSQCALDLREIYAKRALLLFHPLRELSDITAADGSYWTKLQEARDIGILWDGADNILQNIQNKINSKHLVRPKDQVAKSTTCKEATGKGNTKSDDGIEFDLDPGQLDELLCASLSDTRDPNNQYQRRSHHHLRHRGRVRETELVGAPLTDESVFLASEEQVDNIPEAETSAEEQQRPDFGTVIEFIGHALGGPSTVDDFIGGNGDNGLHDVSREPPTLERTAQQYELHRDEKQLAVFEIISAAFLLDVLNDDTASGPALAGVLGPLNQDLASHRRSLQSELRDRLSRVATVETVDEVTGQLIMYLTGPAGCGKSHAVYAAQAFARDFSQHLAIIFDDNTFWFTACTGSAAALWGGITIHSAAYLNCNRIAEDYKKEWMHVRILIIDEISYFSDKDLRKLDNCLRKLRDSPDQAYGGISIIFAGDFHQIKTMSGNPIYAQYLVQWHGYVNCVVMLDGAHRFKDDKGWGEILRRIRNGEDTPDDRQKINERWLGHCNISLPKSGDICYACPTNREQNAINAAIFENHLRETHPKIDELDKPIPTHTIIIEASFRQQGKPCSNLMHETIQEYCGDSSIRTSHHKKIDALIRFYMGCPFMINSNNRIKERLGNGTLCKGVAVKLKPDAVVTWKNWDGRRVNTVSVNDVEYIVCKHCNETKKRFKLKPETDGVVISLNVLNSVQKIGKVKATQFGVNSNIATTGHKLQGMSKDNLVVKSWTYQFDNWIYVVLSRVRTMKGLFLCEKLDLDKPFTVDPKIIAEEKRLEGIEAQVLEKWRSSRR